MGMLLDPLQVEAGFTTLFMLVLLSENILQILCLKMTLLTKLRFKAKANVEISDFAFLNSNAN